MKNVDFLMCGGERLVIVRNVSFFLYYKFLCVFECFFIVLVIEFFDSSEFLSRNLGEMKEGGR